jgi:hypothetical protein
MKNFLKKLIDSGNSEVEAHLVLLCLGALTLIALSIYHVVYLRHAFDPDPYGQGLGYLLAGSGAAAWGQGLQRRTENEKDKNDEPDQ